MIAQNSRKTSFDSAGSTQRHRFSELNQTSDSNVSEGDTPLYKIARWNEIYESSETRKIKKLKSVLVPTKHDGKTFRRLMMMPHGAAIYGAWILILEVAAKCSTRGELADEDGPLTAEDIAIMTGCPEETIEEALQVCSSDRIGWISCGAYEESGASPEASGDSPEISGATERNGRERKTIKKSSVQSVSEGEALEKPPRDSSASQESVFSEIAEEHLSNQSALRKWFSWQSNQPGAVYPDATDEELQNLFALGRQAVAEAKSSKVGLFCSLVGVNAKARPKYRRNEN